MNVQLICKPVSVSILCDAGYRWQRTTEPTGGFISGPVLKRSFSLFTSESISVTLTTVYGIERVESPLPGVPVGMTVDLQQHL